MIPVIDDSSEISVRSNWILKNLICIIMCIIKNIASDRQPGPDGITANFYKHFWEEIKVLLLKAINECTVQK